MTTAEKLTTIAANQQAVFEAGKQAEQDRFWDEYQRKGKNKYCIYAFAGSSWTDANYNPKYPITPTGNAQYMYAYSGITDTKVPIVLSGTVTNCAYMFTYSELKTVALLRVEEHIPMHTHFSSCSKLENLTIEGTIGRNASFQDCKNLTAASMKSVIAALKNWVGTGSENTCTLRFHADCWARLEADSAAPNGGSWQDYVHSLGWLTA